MALPLRSLRFRLVAFPLALLVFWLALTLTGAIYDARQRIAAEVKASAALAQALVEATVARIDTAGDPVSALKEVERQLPVTRHVRMGVLDASQPASLEDAVVAAELQSPAPRWFIELISASPSAQAVDIRSTRGKIGSVYIIPNPADEIGEVWEDFCFVSLFSTALIAVIVGCILWAANHALRPLDALGSGLARLERGDFNVSLKPLRVDELERIGEQFNRLAHSLDQARAENRLLCQRLVSVQESERNHIARELHDELGPCLFGIRAEAACIIDSANKGHLAPAETASRANSIEALVETVQQINRRLLYTLQPVALAERGLAAALRDLVEGWRSSYPDIHWLLELTDKELEGLAEEVSLAVYRVAQEGLTNIARHAACTHAKVEIRRENGCALGDALHVSITDNGKGLSRADSNGTGLFGMRERVRNLGGEFTVSSGSGSGVSVKALIPLARAENL